MAFKKQTTDSFYGDFLYDSIVPKNHFLRKAKETIDWDRFTHKLLKHYKGKAETGRSPYNPSLLLRMLFVSYLYNTSERQTEESVNFNLPMKYFVGLGVDEKAPDHSTLAYFKERLLEGGVSSLEEIFNEMLIQAKRKGAEFGEIQILDATHTQADINIDRDNGRKRKGKESVDKDASWGVKHSRKVKDDHENIYNQKQCFLGYKTHASMNEKTGIVTSLKVTPGNNYDGKYLPDLVKKDKKKNIISKKKLRKLQKENKKQIYTADKGYDDGDNHTFLESHGIASAIRIRDTRIKKKDKNKEPWTKLVNSKEYQEGLAVRYKIERKFGDSKKNHGLGRARYRGIKRYNLQATLTFMVLNLKEIMKITAGVYLKSIPKAT